MRILPREVENFFHVADGDAVPERAALGRVTGRSRQGRQCIASAKGMPRDFGADHPTDIRRSGTRALRWSHLVTSPKHFRQRCTLHSLQAVCGRCGLPPRSGVRRVPLSPRSPVVARPEHARHVLCLGKYATGWRFVSYPITTDSSLSTHECVLTWLARGSDIWVTGPLGPAFRLGHAGRPHSSRLPGLLEAIEDDHGQPRTRTRRWPAPHPAQPPPTSFSS